MKYDARSRRVLAARGDGRVPVRLELAQAPFELGDVDAVLSAGGDGGDPAGRGQGTGQGSFGDECPLLLFERGDFACRPGGPAGAERPRRA
jgi:hypothetical protein